MPLLLAEYAANQKCSAVLLCSADSIYPCTSCDGASDCVVGSNVTTAADLSVTIALSVLGALYAIVAFSACFVIVPRLMTSPASAAAAGLNPGASTAVQVGMRPRLNGVRWSPGYGGGGMPRIQPGEVERVRELAQMQRLRRLYAAPNRRFPVPNQVLE